MSNLIYSTFEVREPIIRAELRSLLNIQNEHSFNQYIFVLLKFGLIKSFQNGIYYIPEKEERFKDLVPSLMDVINKKYCDNYCGFRTGAALLNQYRFTSQVSSDYEILTSNVSMNSRNVKVFNGKASVSSSKVPINKSNYYYIVFAEILKNIKYSDYNEKDNIIMLQELFQKFGLVRHVMQDILKYYKGNRLLYMHFLFERITNNESAWK